MNRLRFPLLAAMCLIAPPSAAWSAPVPGARSGLEQVPDTAPIVIHLRGIQGTRDRFVAMMENALPDVLKKIQPAIDDFLENGPEGALKGRKLKGLAKNGPIFWVFTELPKPDDAMPKIAIIAAVSNYKEFRDNVLTEEERKNIKDEGEGIESVNIESKPVYFLDRKGFAVISPDKDVAASFTKKITGLHTRMSKEQAAKLLGSDLGVFVNMDTINKTYGDEIKQAKKGIEQALDLGAGAGEESQKKAAEMFKKAMGPIFQGIEDMQAVVLTVEMRPGGLALHVQSEMKESSTTANLLQDSRPIALKELERFPAGQHFYMGMKTSSALYKGLGSLMFGIPLGKGADESKDIAAAMEELAQAGPTVRLDGFAFPISGLTVAHYDDPAKAVAASVKVFKAMAAGDPKSLGLREKPVVKMDAEKFGDFKLHSIELDWDFEKLAESVAQQGDAAKKQYIESMKNLLGDKLTLWFGTDGKSYVQVTAADWAAARKILEQYSKGAGTVGDSKAFQDVRKEMPARTSLLGLIDAVHLFGDIYGAVKPLLPAGQVPLGWPNMPAKGTASFVGLAVTLQPQRGSFDFFISAAAAQEFYKAVVKPLVRD